MILKLRTTDDPWEGGGGGDQDLVEIVTSCPSAFFWKSLVRRGIEVQICSGRTFIVKRARHMALTS